MTNKISDRLWLALAVSLFGSSTANADVPIGATSSLPALRQAYIDAAKTHRLAALETLFDFSSLPAEYYTAFRQMLTEGMINTIHTVVISDPSPSLTAEWKKVHAHFNYPVIKIITINYMVSYPERVNLSQYYIGTSSGKYFFVTAAGADK